MRWVTDLRELNKHMIKFSNPLTNIQEILHSLQDATVYWERRVYSIYQPLWHIPEYMFGSFNTGSVYMYSKMLDVAMKEVD